MERSNFREIGVARTALATIALSLTLAACLAACQSDDDAPAPENGPSSLPLSSDVLVFNGQQTGNFEIYRMTKGSDQAMAITNNAAFDSWWPRISPDRRQIVFYRTPAGTGDDYAQTALWVMNADGSEPRELIAQGQYGWTIQGHAEWSPDGTRLVMCGTANATVHIFTTDASGNNPIQKTTDGTWNCDPAFSRDGSQIIFNRCESAGPCSDPATKPDLELYLMPASGGAITGSQMTRLTNNALADYDAYFSPDGSTIAWLQLVSPTAWNGVGAWSIKAMSADGSNQRAVVDDGFINSKPAWSSDGQTIYTHRLDATSNGKWGLFQIPAAGGTPQRIGPQVPANLEFVSN